MPPSTSGGAVPAGRRICPSSSRRRRTVLPPARVRSRSRRACWPTHPSGRGHSARNRARTRPGSNGSRARDGYGLGGAQPVQRLWGRQRARLGGQGGRRGVQQKGRAVPANTAHPEDGQGRGALATTPRPGSATRPSLRRDSQCPGKQRSTNVNDRANRAGSRAAGPRPPRWDGSRRARAHRVRPAPRRHADHTSRPGSAHGADRGGVSPAAAARPPAGTPAPLSARSGLPSTQAHRAGAPVVAASARASAAPGPTGRASAVATIAGRAAQTPKAASRKSTPSSASIRGRSNARTGPLTWS